MAEPTTTSINAESFPAIQNLHDAPSIRVNSGILVNPLALRVEDVRIEDIAHGLSNLCRFGGHVRDFYSVAQHSALVSDQVHPKDKLWGLLHDASEAYLIDLPRPLKWNAAFGPFYREIEAAIMRTICQRFDLPEQQPERVGYYDKVLLVTEQRDLVNQSEPSWDVAPLARHIVAWNPGVARAEFMLRFLTLTREVA